jgi:hypothetical protein
MLSRENARKVLDDLNVPLPVMSGRGIVICAGGVKYNTNAYANIRLLRKLGCTLPIQLWYLPHEHDDVFNELVQQFNVTCVNAEDVLKEHPHSHLNGWELKSYAIKWCPFQEVLFIDADCFAIRNPEPIFEEEAFKEHGAIFMPDVRKMPSTHKFWGLFQIPYVEEDEFESGAIFIDKSRCWREVCIADYINEHGIAFYWREAGMHGDKDSWNAAFHVTGRKFAMTSTPVHHLEGCGIACLVQYDLQGERLWLHRNLAKFQLYGDNPRLPGFTHEDVLLRFVEDLRGAWLGSSEPGDEWVGKRFMYYRLGLDSRPLTLGARGVISENPAGRERFWYKSGEALYVVGDDGALSFVCVRTVNESRIWVGRWLNYEKCPIVLVEVV